MDRGRLVSTKKEPVQIPFELVQNVIIIPVKVNGVEGRFLFDNGFSLSAVHPKFAKKAGIAFKGGATLRDANNKQSKAKVATVDEVNINGQFFINTGFYRVDTKVFFPCDDIDGVIGASIINKINWEIDFEQRQILLSSKPFENNGIRFNIGYSSNNSSFVNLSVSDKTVQCKIDLGRSGSIKLNRKSMYTAFINHKVKEEIGIASLSAGGLGNIDTTYEIVNPVKIQFNEQPLPIDGNVLLAKKTKYRGYIGLEYFRNYKLTINSTNKQYILSERDIEESAIKKSYGISIYLVNEKWKVIRINPNNVNAKGIRLMDEIDRLDGLPIDRFNSICEYRDYVKAKINKGEPLSIMFKGSPKTIELQLKIPATNILK